MFLAMLSIFRVNISVDSTFLVSKISFIYSAAISSSSIDASWSSKSSSRSLRMMSLISLFFFS